jgi:hypothetical protein
MYFREKNILKSKYYHTPLISIMACAKPEVGREKRGREENNSSESHIDLSPTHAPQPGSARCAAPNTTMESDVCSSKDAT